MNSCYRYIAVELFVIAFLGCGASVKPKAETSSPSDKGTQLQSPSHQAASSADMNAKPREMPHPDADPIRAFLKQDSFCRDVLERRSLADLQAEMPSASKDGEQSRPDIGYAVYRHGGFMYEFLGRELFAIRYLLPRNAESASKTIVSYHRAFGPPTNTTTPDEFKRMEATKFLSWDLPEHNLRVNFACLKSQFADVEMDLFGQFINVERAKEYMSRMNRTVSAPMDIRDERNAAEATADNNPNSRSSISRLDQQPKIVQVSQKRSTSGASAEHRDPAPNTCRSLKLARELVNTIEIVDQRTATLWATLGKCYIDAGDLDSAQGVLQSLEGKPQGKQVVLAKSVLAARIAPPLVAAGRIDEAAEVSKHIPASVSDQRCTALSGIAAAFEVAGDTENATRFWNLAIQAASGESVLARQRQNQVIVIRSLADHGRFKEALQLPLLDGRDPDRSGWGPLAVGLAKFKKNDAAEQAILLQMKGLNQDLLAVIERVAPDGNVGLCETALSMMNDPLYVGLGRCHLATEQIESGKREEARKLLAETFQELEKAKIGQAATGRFLLGAISPMTRLEGASVGRDICGTLEKSFSPELAAEAYGLFAFWRFPLEKSDSEEGLEKAGQILIKVSNPLERSLLFRRIYRTRSSLLGEENGLSALEKISDRIDKCYATMGVAEGLYFPKKH